MYNLSLIHIFTKSIWLVFIFSWLSRRCLLYQTVNQVAGQIEDSVDYLPFAQNFILFYGPHFKYVEWGAEGFFRDQEIL